MERKGHEAGSEWGRMRVQSGHGTEDEVRQQMGSRRTAWLISVPENIEYNAPSYKIIYMYILYMIY